MNEEIQEILNKLERDLNETSSPSERIIQMGCFVEIINLSLNDTITMLTNNQFSKSQKNVSFGDYWSKIFDDSKYNESLAELKPHLRYAVNELSVIYWARNKCAHNDPLKDQIIADCDIYQRRFIRGIEKLLDQLRGWSLNTQHKTFEESLIKYAERRPHFILIDQFYRTLSQCSRTLSSRGDKIRGILNSLSHELNLSYALDRTLTLEEDIDSSDSVNNLAYAHYDLFRGLCRRASPDIFNLLQKEIEGLLQCYIDESLWNDEEYSQYIRPFIEKHLKTSKEEEELRYNFKTLYLKLDHDDLTSPGWPQRLNHVRLIPNIRKGERIIDYINDGTDEVFHDTSELATFIKKKLVNPLMEIEIDTKDLALVIELDGFNLAHEEFHLSKQDGKQKIEVFFKSVLIRLTDDPTDAASLKGRYVKSFIPENESSALVTKRVEEDLADEVHSSSEVVLIAEEAVHEDFRDVLYEKIYQTYIPLIVMSLDSKLKAQELIKQIFDRPTPSTQITLDQLFARIKFIRTEIDRHKRIPIQLFIDDAEFIPSVATPL